MKTLFYNTNDAEWQYLQKEACTNKHISFIREALWVETAGLSEHFDAICIGSTDDASATVLKALYEHGIRYITIRAAKNSSIDIAKASELGIVIANVPFCPPVLPASAPVDLIAYMVVVTFYNLDCRRKDLASGNELNCDGHLPQATIYLR